MARPEGARGAARIPRVLYGIGALILLGLYAATQFEIERDARPVGGLAELHALRDRDDLNLLFIVIDTLRADRLGSHGYARDTSRNLDLLAERGVRFARHLAQSSWTKASMASLWTGLYPARTGVHRYMHAMPSEALMSAEILSAAGFRTAGIWRNGWVAPNFGFDQGFQIYSRPMSGPVDREVRKEHPGATVSGSDADVTLAALEFLRSVGDDRWFLYLHLMDVHQYASDEESAIFGTTYSDFYDNALHWTDRNIGVLLTDLRRRGLLERTLVVVVSDHGEGFREHGTEGHARNLYGEVTETPLILSLPFRTEAPIVVESPTLNIDVWPTLLDMLGLPPLANPDGESLVPAIEAALRGEVWRPERRRFAELDTSWGNPSIESNRTFALTLAQRRAHVNREGETELYDLESDPREQQDLAAMLPEEAARLRAVIEEHERAGAPPWTAREVELDAMLLHQLRALGYHIE